MDEYDERHHCSNPNIKGDKYPFAIDSIPSQMGTPINTPQTAKHAAYTINQQAQSCARKQQHPAIAPNVCSVENDTKNH